MLIIAGNVKRNIGNLNGLCGNLESYTENEKKAISYKKIMILK